MNLLVFVTTSASWISYFLGGFPIFAYFLLYVRRFLARFLALNRATYEFLIFIDFILVFPLLLHLRRSDVGFISVLFAHRFLHRFLVDLGVDFGALLGAFGGSKSIIFGINFGMIFACRSKSGLRAPKSGPRAPKSAPRAPKRGPKGAKSGPRGAQERPRGAQERPQSTQ